MAKPGKSISSTLKGKTPPKPWSKDRIPSINKRVPRDNDDDEEEEQEDVEYFQGKSKFEEGSSQGSGIKDDLEGEEDEEEDPDPDAPHIVQWEDDEEDYLDRDLEEEEGGDEKEHNVISEKALQNNLKELSLGALRRAQRALSQAEPESDSGSDSEESHSESEGGKPEPQSSKGKGKEKVEWSARPRTDIAKRANKHAPTEVTSKKPVTRRRTVVEVPKIVARDPRFLATAGQFSQEKFAKSYSFLTGSHKNELAALRETLKEARKSLSSIPKDLRNEKEEEIHKLELAVKHAESAVNKDRLDQVEREALSKVKKQEKEKREQGKKEWFLKKDEKQKLVMQARYEALAKEGGQRAVKKAIEKKQKKIAQKEKRSRPYAKGEDMMSRKRMAESDSGWPSAKRRRNM